MEILLSPIVWVVLLVIVYSVLSLFSKKALKTEEQDFSGESFGSDDSSMDDSNIDDQWWYSIR